MNYQYKRSFSNTHLAFKWIYKSLKSRITMKCMQTNEVWGEDSPPATFCSPSVRLKSLFGSSCTKKEQRLIKETLLPQMKASGPRRAAFSFLLSSFAKSFSTFASLQKGRVFKTKVIEAFHVFCQETCVDCPRCACLLRFPSAVD